MSTQDPEPDAQSPGEAEKSLNVNTCGMWDQATEVGSQ